MSGMRRVAGLMLLCLAVMPPSAADAQVPFDVCLDRQGRVIPGVVDNTLPYAGVATMRDSTPVILWNQKENRHLDETVQILIYLHECAHHTLGHIYSPDSPAAELEADCWAIQLMVDGGMIKPRHLEVLEESARTVRGDALHLGGKALVQSLERCLDRRTDPKAWAAALDTIIRASQDSFASSSGRVLDSTPTGPIYQSAVGTPGTFNCEVAGAALRCLVFASRELGPAKERFERLTRILRAWLPVGWTSVQPAPASSTEGSFLAQDGMTGTLLSLLLKGPRVYFLLKRVPV